MDLYFMPSDIARLILGYLKENSYSKTYNCFLKECVHLRELYNLEKAGRSLKKVTQLSLITIVQEWGRFKYSSDRSDGGSNQLTETPSSDDTVDDNDVISSGRKTKQRPRSSSKKSPCLSKAGRSPRTPKTLRTKSKSPRKTLSQSVECKNTSKNDGAIYKSPQGTQCSTPTEHTPEKLSVHAAHVEVSENCNIALHSNVNLSQFEISKTSACEKRNVSSSASDNYIKTPDKTVLQSDDVNLDVKASREEGDGRKLSEQSGGTDRSEHENMETTVLEAHHRNTRVTDDLPVKDAGSRTHTIMSETFIKQVVEPPSESVGSFEDKCISWMTRNESENTNSSAGSGEVKERADGSEKNHVQKSVILQQLNKEEIASKSNRGHGVDSSKPSNHSPEGASNCVLVTPKKASNAASVGHRTPARLRHVSDHNSSKSPRRKKPKTPRKRAEVSPVSVVSAKSVEPSNVNPIFEKILSDHRLHEKLAETCNLVHSQIKLATSGRDKSDTVQAEHETLPAHHPEEQETVLASKSLEEILGLDNFQTDLLSDNIDMSDPVFGSMFKLFGTDRETFYEYLRKERDNEMAQMEAELDEFERSHHEIYAMPADAEYETQELAYSSPHHMPLSSQQDLFATQSASQSPRTSHVTSTPCETGAPVNFTPLLHGHELGNSPIHPPSSVFGSAGNAVLNKKTSPCSTTTQPFSPALSHYSEVNNPPTPRHQHLSTYISGSCHGNSPGGPSTPRNQQLDLYSNPATPQQASPEHQMLHSTPTGSVRSTTNSDHFHQSSPIHPQHSVVSNMHVPANCSPLVKADLHPHSPFATQNQAGVFQSSTNNRLYFNSQSLLRNCNQNNENFQNTIRNHENETNILTDHSGGYLNLLSEESSNSALPREPCSTIENTIGCISLPQPTDTASKADSPKKKKSEAQKSRRKKRPVKRKESFAYLKQMLNKPLNFPNSVLLTMKAPGLPHLPRTPDKKIPREANLTFPSPGGKTMINVPVLNCEDEIDLSILGIDDHGENEGGEIVNVYDQNLDVSTQYAINPENQATHGLVNAIQAGDTAEAVKQLKGKKSGGNKPTKKSNSERRSRSRKKKEVAVEENEEQFDPTPPSIDPHVYEEGLDPNEEIYTATPDTSLGKAATARALDFGPEVQYRKIMPKPSEAAPSVLILSRNQVINPGNKIVVNSTPVTLVQNVANSSAPIAKSNEKDCVNRRVEELSKAESISTVKIIDMSKTDSNSVEKIANFVSSKSTESYKSQSMSNSDTEIVSENILEKTPVKSRQKYRRNEQSSNEKRITRSCSLSNSSEKQNRATNNNPSNSQCGRHPRRECSKTENSRKSSSPMKDVGGDACASLPNKHSSPSCAQTVKNIQNKGGKKGDSEKHVIKNKERKSKVCRDKTNHEKLKVKFPIISHKSQKGTCNGKLSEKTGNPFPFKKKLDKVSSASSEENIPLSELRKKPAKAKSNTRKQKEFKSVAIITDSESSDEELAVTKDDHQVTPKKTSDFSDEDRTSSKEILLEKIGLTPKKSHMEQEFKSPTRTNVLDVLAEWQGSPMSSRSGRRKSDKGKNCSSLDTMKSPTTPRKKVHAKQLFTSPDKKSVTQHSRKAKQTAKRVEHIIDRLKQNNPERNLAESLQTHAVSNITSESDSKDKKEHKDKSRSKSRCKDKSLEKKSLTGLKDGSSDNITRVEITEVASEVPVTNKDSDTGSQEPNEGVNSDSKAFISENSQDAAELNRAIASIEFHEPDTWPKQEPTHSDEVGIEEDVVRDIERENDGRFTEYDTDHLSEKHKHSMEGNEYHKLDGFQSDKQEADSPEQSTFIVTAEVHSPLNSQDAAEEDKQSTFYVTQEIVQHTDKEIENPLPDNDSGNRVSESENVETINENLPVTVGTEIVNTEPEHRRKSKKKKHKHKHRHHHKREGDANESAEHHKKRKKSKKRRREEGRDEEPEHKRRKKDKANKSAEMESLAAIDIDEAITKIYGT